MTKRTAGSYFGQSQAIDPQRLSAKLACHVRSSENVVLVWKVAWEATLSAFARRGCLHRRKAPLAKGHREYKMPGYQG
jgi:hypothetical protein